MNLHNITRMVDFCFILVIFSFFLFPKILSRKIIQITKSDIKKKKIQNLISITVPPQITCLVVVLRKKNFEKEGQNMNS